MSIAIIVVSALVMALLATLLLAAAAPCKVPLTTSGSALEPGRQKKGEPFGSPVE